MDVLEKQIPFPEHSELSPQLSDFTFTRNRTHCWFHSSETTKGMREGFFFCYSNYLGKFILPTNQKIDSFSQVFIVKCNELPFIDNQWSDVQTKRKREERKNIGKHFFRDISQFISQFALSYVAMLMP